MTDDQYAFWTAYVRAIADQLGLRDWNVIINRDIPETDFRACAHPARGRRSGGITLAQLFFNGSPEEQRQTIIHELLHMHTDDVDTAVFHVKEQLGSDVLHVLFTTVRDRIEFVVDNVATAIAPFYPLPEVSNDR